MRKGPLEGPSVDKGGGICVISPLLHLRVRGTYDQVLNIGML